MTTAQYIILGTGAAAFAAMLVAFKRMQSIPVESPELSAGDMRAPVPDKPAFAEPVPPPPVDVSSIVVEVADDDPRMLGAIAEAKRRWPEFVHAFNRRKSSQSFTVKLPFRDDLAGDSEFMWVEVIRIDGNEIHGSLINQPFYVKNYTMHDSVEARVMDLCDWVYTQEGESIGGFTNKVLDEAEQQAVKEAEQKQKGQR